MNKTSKQYQAGYVAGLIDAQKVAKQSSYHLIQQKLFNFIKGLKA